MKLYNRIFFLFFVGNLIFTSIEAQSIKYGFSGFIKSDLFWDSRQVASARQGHFLLYPLNENVDLDGNDINQTSCFHILPIQSRLIFTAKEKKIFGADAFAKIEGEFFGTSNIGINNFRLRHAFLKLSWSNSKLLIGQYWHPIFIETNYPGTISFNTGVPFIPFSRNPQIRYTYVLGDMDLSVTGFTQLDFMSSGPLGAQPNYAIQAGLPGLNARLVYHPSIGNTKLNMGFSLNTKSIKPQLITVEDYKDETVVRTYAMIGFLGLKFPKFSIKSQVSYGEDMFNLTSIGGYGIAAIDSKGYIDYSANRTLSFWTDIHNNNPTHNVGILLGYTSNLGSSDIIISSFYGRGHDIDYVYRVSPRYAYKVGNIKFATEFEFTVAAYGTPNEYGKVENSNEVRNLRILIASYYLFNTSLN